MNQLSVSPLESSKRTAFNMICNTATHFLSAVIAFIITPFLIARIGMEAYGFYPISAEIMTLFGLVPGIINATSGRYITVEEARGNGEEASRYFSTVFFSNVGLCGILLFPMGLFVTFADRILSVPEGYIGELRVFFVLALASVLVNALVTAFGSAYMIANRIDLRSGQEFIAVLLKAAVLFGLLGGGFSSSIVSVGIALLLSCLAGAVIQILMCRRLVPSLRLSVSLWSAHHARRVITSGFWYTLDRLGAFLMTGMLLLVSNVIFTAEGVGVYSVSVTASRFLGGVLLMLAGVLLPTTAKRFARGEDTLLCREVERNQKITGYFASVGVAVGIGFFREFFSLWLGGEADPLLTPLAIISILPMVAVATALPLVDLGVVMDRMRRLSLLFVGCGLLTFAAVLIVATVTPFGTVGVAAVSCVAQLLWYAGLVPLFAGRILRVKARRFYVPVLRCLFACAVTTGLVFLIKNVAPIEGWTSFLVIVSMSATVSAVVNFLLVFGKPKFKM